MGMSILSTFTLKRTRGMGMHKGLCSSEGVLFVCYVSGYCGAMVACNCTRYHRVPARNHWLHRREAMQ